MRHPKISRDLIISTAASILDDDGIEALSMRSIAQKLSVKAMSLYNYVENKEDLLTGIVEKSISEIKVPEPSVNWREDLRSIALSFYEMLIQHPNLLPVISTHSPITEKGIGKVEKLFLILKGINITGLEAFSLMHIMIAYVIGHVAITITNNRPSGEQNKEINLERFPGVLEAYMALDKRNYKEEFLYGLDLLLGSLLKKRTERK